MNLNINEFPQINNINKYVTDLNGFFNKIDDSIKNKEKIQEEDFKEQYTKEIIKIKKSFEKLKEEENKDDLKKHLQKEKQKICDERENILKSTIKVSLENKKHKESLKELKNNNNELNEELEFLLEQINKSAKKNELLYKKISTNKKIISDKHITSKILKEDLFDVLPYSIQNNYQNINQLLGIISNKLKKTNNLYNYTNIKPKLNNIPQSKDLSKLSLEYLRKQELNAKSLLKQIQDNTYIIENIMNKVNNKTDNIKPNNLLESIFMDIEFKNYWFHKLKLYFDE